MIQITKIDAIKSNPLRLLGGVISGIFVGVFIFLSLLILHINIQASDIGFILFSLILIAISGYVSYRLVDEANKIKITGAIIGILLSITIFFIIFFIGSYLKQLMKIPHTDNYINSQNIMFLSQIISAIIGGLISYRIGKSHIATIIVVIIAPALSFLILMMIAF